MISIETDSNLSQKSVTITRRTSKPSRHESIQLATSQTRQHQRDRYINYRNRLKENKLYSLIVSSNGIECYGSNCQPSLFNASHRCRIISSENDIDAFKNSPLMNDQNIKQNISYVSLTNLSNIIDHEPNVSRRDSYLRSTSNTLIHKPSLFLADIFSKYIDLVLKFNHYYILDKMTHAQRAKSIAQLIKLHENLTESNSMLIDIIHVIIQNIFLMLATIDKPQRITSLPNFNNKPTKLHSVTSLLFERTTANITQIENKTTSDFIDQKIHTPVHISELPNDQTISSPVKLVSLSGLDSLSERKSPEENKPIIHTNDLSAATSATSSPIVHPLMIKPSPSKRKVIVISSFLTSSINIVSIKSIHTTTNIGKVKISRSNHFLDADLNEQTSTSKLKPFKTSKTEQIKVQSLNLIKLETNLENNNDLFSKSSGKYYSKNNSNPSLKVSSSSNKAIEHTSQSKVSSSSITNKEKQMPSLSPHFQSSNDENEIENSLNDVTDHLSQQDIIIPNTNLDKSFDISSKESNKIKNTSPSILTSKKILSKTSTKPELTSLLPIDNGDISTITRTTTVSTNLTINNDDDDDEQSKLINEQLKRSSLGLARDSLELLRNATSHHGSNDEQLTPHINIDSTPHKRKSVLKSRIDSSDNLPTPELISYIAIDEVKGDKRLMEKQMRYDF